MNEYKYCSNQYVFIDMVVLAAMQIVNIAVAD